MGVAVSAPCVSDPEKAVTPATKSPKTNAIRNHFDSSILVRLLNFEYVNGMQMSAPINTNVPLIALVEKTARLRSIMNGPKNHPKTLPSVILVFAGSSPCLCFSLFSLAFANFDCIFKKESEKSTTPKQVGRKQRTRLTNAYQLGTNFSVRLPAVPLRRSSRTRRCWSALSSSCCRGSRTRCSPPGGRLSPGPRRSSLFCR